MKQQIAAWLCLIGLCCVAVAADQKEFKGKLRPELIAGRDGYHGIRLSPAPVEEATKLSSRLGNGDRVFTGRLGIGPWKDSKVVVVARATGDSQLLIDFNNNGVFEDAERFVLPQNSTVRVSSGVVAKTEFVVNIVHESKEAAVALPISIGMFPTIPMKCLLHELQLLQGPAAIALARPLGFRLPDGSAAAATPASPTNAETESAPPLLGCNIMSSVDGTVDIKGQPTLVRYTIDLESKSVDL